ncbi:MAG: hypothetical protein JWQ11_535 [Rhizobacter sp.]|nr:hypothetical protein [Rhizobacter sp.]
MKNKRWLDETDAALDDAAQRYLGERYEFAARQRLPGADRRFGSAVWSEMAEMGWLSVSTPESLGGLGMRIASIGLLAEAAGRGLVNEPLAACGMLAPFLIARHGTAAQRDALLPAMLEGRLLTGCVLPATGRSLVVASEGRLRGRCEVVIDADLAERFIVAAGAANGAALFLVDAADVQRRSYPLLDGRAAATLTFDRAACEPMATDVDLRPVLQVAALATAADSLGAMSAAFELTLAYLKTRQQFKVPLATHQALQHRAVDMHIRISESRAVLDQAIASFEEGSARTARDVHAAKSFVCENARLLVQEAVQLHGGIGITEEYAISHYLRRVRVNEQLYGSAEQHFVDFMNTAAPAAF